MPAARAEPAPASSWLIQKLGRLTEIARVLDINRADGDFGEKENGRIQYVFDTNVFQMFLKPYSFSRYLELFHSSLWGKTSAEQLVNSEAALIAGEYLFSRKLPFQESAQIIVSSWHHIELLEQIGRLLAEAREAPNALDYGGKWQEGMNRLDNLSKLLHSSDTNQFERMLREAGEVARRDDAMLEDQGVPVDKRIEIFAVRAICAFLAEDRYTEPVEQLRRMLAREVAPFVSHSDVAQLAITDELRDEFDRAEANWAQRLRKADRAVRLRLARRRLRAGAQAKGRGSRQPSAGARLPTSIEHDSKTLAWLDIAARHLVGPKQRLIFVTGDRVVLNACRRRNADEPGQPVFVRSIQHFAPLLNLNDAKSDLESLGDARAHFARMRQALEQSLALLNLSLDEEDAAGRRLHNAITGRDNFIVEAEEKDGEILQRHHEGLFAPFFNEQWVKQKEEELDAIARPVQELERLAAGSFSDKVIARVESNTALKLLREWRASSSTEDLGSAIQRVMRKLLDNVSMATMDFAIKWAPQFITSLSGESSKLFGRAVYRLRLHFPIEGQKEAPAEAYVEQLVRDELPAARAKLELLRGNPTLLFSLATILAFRSERWGLAANMAELAVEAVARESGPELGEIEYIRSVALRYRIASVEPDPEEASEDVWYRWLRAADEAQTTALASFPEDEYPVRHSRSLSERAAARLAYLEWVAYARLDQLRIHQQARRDFHERVEQMFGDVAKDLAHCEALSGMIGISVTREEPDTRSEHAAGIRNHCRWNMVVADITSARLADLGLLPSQARTLFATPALLEALPSGDEHLIYDIYRRHLTGEMDPAAVKRINKGMREGELSLALDRMVARDLLAKHGRGPAPSPSTPAG